MRAVRLAAPALIATLAMTPALGQGITTSALRGLDTRAPVAVDADRIDVFDRDNQAIFTGNVRVQQGTLTLESNRIRVSYEQPRGASDPEIRRLDADGNVRIATPTERASGRFGIYDVERRILTLVGDVRLAQGTTRLQGNRLTIDLQSGRSTLDGRTSTGQPGSRVSGRFAVPERRP